jgi:hypothetical protein
MHENQANKKLLYEKELDEEAIKIPAAKEASYQQALDDFAIADLVTKVKKHCLCDQASQRMQPTFPESEMIAALLIKQLSLHLDCSLVEAYLKAIRIGNQEIVPEPISLEYPPDTKLPPGFLAAVTTPRYTEGQILRLRPVLVDSDQETTDIGICIGRYYAYNPHGCWMWKYVVWLDKNSLSASWCKATTAWEEHLCLFTQKEAV